MRRVKPTMQNVSQKKYVYANYAKTDKLMRYAFDSSISATSFKRLTEDIRKNDNLEQQNCSLLIGALAAMGAHEKLQVFMDLYNCGGIHPYYTFIHLGDILRETLVVSMIFGKTAACEKLLSEYFHEVSPFMELFAHDNRRSFESNPLYYIMLTKRYELVDVYMDILRNNMGRNWLNESDEATIHIDVDLTFISALLYDEREFVRAMLDSGYRPKSDVFAELAAYPNVFDEYRKNYFSYYFPERNRPPRMRDFLSRALIGDELFKFAYLVYDKFGVENADGFFAGIDFPKISVVSSSMLLVNRLRRYSFDNDKPVDEKSLLKLIDDRLYIIADITNVAEMVKENAQAFEGKELIYDMRGNEDGLGFCSACNLTNKMLKDFLSQKLLFNTDEGCSQFLLSVLERNNRTLTDLVIKQGMITQENFSAAIKFLSDNHLLIALNEINKANFMS